MAPREPFDAFGILYYPVFSHRTDLPTTVDDIDMAWAVTADANLVGTGFTLSQLSILTLARCHHARPQNALGINPLDDLKQFISHIDTTPRYPGFPSQFMQTVEAKLHLTQQHHDRLAHGEKLLARLGEPTLAGGNGWFPEVDTTPERGRSAAFVEPKTLQVIVTSEDLRAIVAARLARATRMSEAELATAMLVFDDDIDTCLTAFPKVAFHENMMSLIYMASKQDSNTLERVAASLAQHPGDLLKAIRDVSGSHLTTRQKKGFCRAFEHFESREIAQNIVDASRRNRIAPNLLSVARFGGPHLREAIELVETGAVRSWASTLEQLWSKVYRLAPVDREQVWRKLFASRNQHSDPSRRKQFDEMYDRLYLRENPELTKLWEELLTHYGKRPGMLLRSLRRLLKAGCPVELLEPEVQAHTSEYSLRTLAGILTSLAASNLVKMDTNPWWDGYREPLNLRLEMEDEDAVKLRSQLCKVLCSAMVPHMRNLKTPLKGKRVHLDTSGVSLVGSMLIPNKVDPSNNVWPPVGIAFDLPRDKTIRFFIYQDNREEKNPHTFLKLAELTTSGRCHILGGSHESTATRHTLVEYVDVHVDDLLEEGVTFGVVSLDIDSMFHYRDIDGCFHSWDDLIACFCGVLAVDGEEWNDDLNDTSRLLFGHDFGRTYNKRECYALVNLPGHYARILHGAPIPLGNTSFSLGSYLKMLFEAQEVTLVDTPDKADVRVCVASSNDPEVISLFDEGFYLGLERSRNIIQ
jgi:hypothetical protein